MELQTPNPAHRGGACALWAVSSGFTIYPVVVYASGGAYDPVTDTWTPLVTPPTDPATVSTFARTGHKAVWTSHGMVVVGGSDGYHNQGSNFPKTIARLSPNLATWTLSAEGDGRVGHFHHCLGTDGHRMVLLWGGQDQFDSDPIGNGTFLIDSASLTAAAMDNADQPAPSRNSTIVCSGKEFIAWGGTWTDGTPQGGG